MDKKSFAMGFVFAVTVLLVVGIMHYRSTPVKAAPSMEPSQWYESENAGYDGAIPTRIVRNNTWATMTANIYAIYDAAPQYSMNEEQARNLACRILYNVYHPADRR